MSSTTNSAASSADKIHSRVSVLFMFIGTTTTEFSKVIQLAATFIETKIRELNVSTTITPSDNNNSNNSEQKDIVQFFVPQRTSNTPLADDTEVILEGPFGKVMHLVGELHEKFHNEDGIIRVHSDIRVRTITLA